MTDRYILDGDGNVVPCPDLDTWGLWFEKANRTIAQTGVGGVWVSTVFLGIDHGFGEPGGPVLFETMIFRSEPGSDEFDGHDLGYQERYRTIAEALAGHETAVDWVREHVAPN